MIFKCIVLLIVGLLLIVLPGALCSAGDLSISFPVPVLPFAPFDDDPAIYNDCNYCHATHNARQDVTAMLNDRGERYERYIGGNSWSAEGDRSVFGDDVSRKCPRSRAKSKRKPGVIIPTR